MSLPKNCWWLPIGLILLIIVFLQFDLLQKLFSQWMSNEDYSHGILILPISLYLIWEKRAVLKKTTVHSDWRALALLVFAIALYTLGELGAELFTTRLALLLFLVGTVWLMYGPYILKQICFPLGYLFLMLPLPGLVYRNVTFPLQTISSVLSVKLLQILGISAYREGNVIDLGFSQFQVVEACSGLRFILPLLALAVLFAFWGKKQMWKRFVLVALTLPIAIFANILRIAGTGLIAMVWGVKAAEGFFHSFSGWIVFMVCFGCFLLINKLLSYLPGKIRPKQSSKYETASQEHSPASLSLAPMLVCILLIVAMPYAVGHFGSVPPVPLKRPLTEFPLTLESMQGRRTEMDPQIWEQVGGQQYIMVDYFSEGKTPVHFYTAYYEQQKKSGDFIHSPKLCLPGAGWHIQINRTRAIALDNPNERHLEKLRFNELITQKNDHRQLVYFWYQGRDRNFTSEWAAKFYMVWDGIWHRRTDGALVRLIMNLRPNQAIADGRLVLDRFALAVAQELQNYLP